MKIKELLDAVKNAKGISTDGELARCLEISKQAVSDYYNNKRAPDDFACLRISEITGLPLNNVIATVKAASEKDEKRREAWENYMKRLGGLAASITFGFGVLVTLHMQEGYSDPEKSESYAYANGNNTNYAINGYSNQDAVSDTDLSNSYGTKHH